MARVLGYTGFKLHNFRDDYCIAYRFHDGNNPTHICKLGGYQVFLQ